jgi:glycosyltransferase involved in cell wall biosynthesis
LPPWALGDWEGGVPRKIMLLAPYFYDGGIERALEGKALWLIRRGYAVEIFVYDTRSCLSGRPNPLLERLRASDVRIRTLPVYGPRLHLVQRSLRLAKIALTEGFEVIDGHELMPNLTMMFANTLLGGRLRTVAEFHTPLKPPPDGIDARTLRRARKLLPRADHIVAVSQGMREQVIDAYQLPRDAVTTIYNFFDLAEMRRRAPDPPDAPVDGPFILGCGRLVEMKGFAELIEAFAVLAVEPRHRALRLLILGEGPLRDALGRCAEQHGVGSRVVFGGFHANPWSYFSRARAFCLTSRGEGFGRVLVEAMACGAPVITSRCPWGPEEVVDQGKYGLLYDVGNVEQLVDRLRALLEDDALRGRLIEAGRTRSEDFDQERVLPALEACFFPEALPSGRAPLRAVDGVDERPVAE